MKKIFVFVLIFMVITACQPSEQAIQQAIAETQAAKPTETAIQPTVTPESTATSTKEPTATKKPTSTITPTIEPTAIPDSIEIKGNGDDVVDLDWPYGVALVEITGNPNSFHFAVKSLDENNETLDLLVNTTDIYYGTKLINLRDGEVVKRFEVSASGEWLITVKPINELRKATSPDSISGIGDDVIGLKNSCQKLRITGNNSSQYFGVIAYSVSEGKTLLVNTTEPYQGTVLCPYQTLLIVITSALEFWEIVLQ